MSQLVFDYISPETVNFVEYRPRHRPEPVSSQFILGNTQTSEGGIYSISRHRALN